MIAIIISANGGRMAKRKKKSAKDVKVPKDKLLAKFTLFFFDRALLTALLWIVLTVFGAVSYGFLMKREGFPSVNIPLAIVGGAYFVNDAEAVDAEIAAPLSEIALEQEGVSSVQSQSGGNFFSVQVVYEEDVEAQAASERLREAVEASGRLPENVNLQYNVPYFGATGGDADKLDLTISFYDRANETSASELADKAGDLAERLESERLADVACFCKRAFSANR